MGLPIDGGAGYEFVCIDCGDDVISYGPRAANEQDVCMTCGWLRNIVDPEEREKIRVFLKER